MGYISVWTSYSADQVSQEILERYRRNSMEKTRYLSAVAGLPLPLMLLDAQGRIENMNPAAASLFGAPGARGGHFSDPSRREAPPVLRDEIREFLAGEEPAASLEREIKTGKGTRYFEVRFTKLRDSEDAYSGMLAVLTDLTYRRSAEDALRRTQNRYVSLFENMPTAFAYTKVVLDARNRPVDYVLMEVNEAFEHMIGRPAESIIGRHLTEVVPGIDGSRHDWFARLGKVAVTGETAAFDALAESLGRWYSVSAYSPAPGFVTLMMSDISELKWVQESLAHSRDFYLTLFEGFPTLIWRAGPDGSHDYFNASWLEFTGRRLELWPRRGLDRRCPSRRPGSSRRGHSYSAAGPPAVHARVSPASPQRRVSLGARQRTSVHGGRGSVRRAHRLSPGHQRPQAPGAAAGASGHA
jgi:PAS domain S-box-containing protein